MIGMLTVSLGIILLILGIAVRSIETLNGNYVFGFDQGADFLAAQSIAVNHKLTLIGAEAGAGFAGLPGVFHGPGYRYVLSILLSLSEGNPYGAIVFLFVLSLVVLCSYYFLGKKLFGACGAAVLTVIAAISPPLTAQARMIWAPNFSALLAVPFIISLWKVETKNIRMLFLTSWLAATLYNFELPMAIPAILGVLLYFAFVLRVRKLTEWIVTVGGVIVGFLPMILFESRHGWGIIRGLGSYVFRAGSSSGKPFNLFFEIRGDWLAFIHTISESFLFPLPFIRNLFPYILLIGSIWFVIRDHNRRRKQFIIGLLILLVSHLLVYIPYRGPVYSHYFSLLYFIYPILGLYVLLTAMEGKISRILSIFLCGLVALGVILEFPKMIAKDYGDYGGTAKVRGKIDAINAIYRDAGTTPFGVMIFTPPVYPHSYEYLFQWYGKAKYGFVPPFKRLDVTYLLIEPDPEKPWSYNGWLETVIKTGKTEKQWKLPSGFILEKRVTQ